MDNEQKISFLHIVYISLKFDYLNNFMRQNVGYDRYPQIIDGQREAIKNKEIEFVVKQFTKTRHNNI